MINRSMNFYTYVYHDGDTPIYVGKGKDDRAYVHLKRKDCHPFTHKLAKMKREGREPRIQIIDAPDEAAAFEMEELLIAMIGRKDLGLGPLLNLTDGGEGPSGMIFSEEVKIKQRAAIKEALACSEVIEKMRQAQKEAQNRPEVKIKKSVATKITLSRPEVKAKQREAAREVNARVEVKINRIVAASKPCTIDGEIIYESRKQLVEALGLGKNGFKHPNFRYVGKETSNV